MSVPKRPVRVSPTDIIFQRAPLRLHHWLLLITASTVVAAVFFIFPNRIPFPAAPQTARDRFNLVGDNFDIKAYRMAKAKSAEFTQAHYLILGTSSIRAALHADSQINNLLQQKKESPVQTLNLSTGAQGFLDGLFLLYEGGLQEGQTVLLFISRRMLSTPLFYQASSMAQYHYLQDPSLFFKSFSQDIPMVHNAMEAFPAKELEAPNRRQLLRRTLLFRLRHWTFNNFYGLTDYEPFPFTPITAKPETTASIATIREHHRRVNKKLTRNFKEFSSENILAFNILAQYISSHRAHLILLESPLLSEITITGNREAWNAYRKCVAKLTDELQIEYVDLNPETNLEPQDFMDSRHVNGQGRLKWSQTFVNWLSKRDTRAAEDM